MSIFDKAAQREKENLPFAVVTVIGSEGRVSRRSGRMVVLPDGEIAGTVGGGAIEDRAIAEAKEAIAEGKGRRITLSNQGKGSIELFIDVPVRSRSLIVVGRGHVGAAVSSLFRTLGWNVTEYDRGTPFSTIDTTRIGNDTAVLIAGAADAHLASSFLQTEAFYIGVLASRTIELPRSGRIHSPVGLDIGAETPEEIAVSVAAEVMSCISHRQPSLLSAWEDRLVIVRGAGDLATGVIIRLVKAGYRVIATEVERPTVIRRTVSLAEAVYDGEIVIEGVTGRLVSTAEDAVRMLDEGIVPVMVDPSLSILDILHPRVLVDATIAKRNLGTRMDMAPLVIALGPGFTAGVDCHAVIETKRGHSLGRVITSGSAIPNTGIPGNIAGYAQERVIHSPAAGVFRSVSNIGDIVRKGDRIAYVSDVAVLATIDGKLRGLLHDGLTVPEGFKIADIDPRGQEADHLTVSDKARAIAGGVLEAIDGFVSIPR